MKDFIFAQSERMNGASYNTYRIDSPATKFGFVCINYAEEIVCHVAFNSAKEYTDLLGWPTEDFEPLESLEVGDEMTFNNGDWYIRLW